MNTPILNTIKTIILIVCLSLVDKPTTTTNLYPKKETWTEKHYNTIMTILVALLLIFIMALFITMCFAFSGNTEANTYYYHMGDL